MNLVHSFQTSRAQTEQQQLVLLFLLGPLTMSQGAGVDKLVGVNARNRAACDIPHVIHPAHHIAQAPRLEALNHPVSILQLQPTKLQHTWAIAHMSSRKTHSVACSFDKMHEKDRNELGFRTSASGAYIMQFITKAIWTGDWSFPSYTSSTKST